MNRMPPALLTRRQAARALCLREQTLAARECRGRPLLPKLKIGGRVCYRLTDVISLIEGSACTGHSSNARSAVAEGRPEKLHE